MARQHHLTAEGQAEVVRRAKAKEKIAIIADDYGVSGSTIYKVIADYKAAGGIFPTKRKATPQIGVEEREYLLETVPKNSPAELKIKQKKAQTGWTEYETRQLLEKKFNQKYTLKDCYLELMKLSVPIGSHSKNVSASVTERMLNSPSQSFTQWLDENVDGQRARENNVNAELTIDGTGEIFAKPATFRSSTKCKLAWQTLAKSLILRDPLFRDPQAIAESILAANLNQTRP